MDNIQTELISKIEQYKLGEEIEDEDLVTQAYWNLTRDTVKEDTYDDDGILIEYVSKIDDKLYRFDIIGYQGYSEFQPTCLIWYGEVQPKKVVKTIETIEYEQV